MNLRFTEDSVRFRISRDELPELLRNGQLVSSTPLPPGGPILRYEIALVAFPAPVSLKCSDGKIVLLVSRDSLMGLVQRLPSKEALTGVETVGQEELKIKFEIDVKR